MLVNCKKTVKIAITGDSKRYQKFAMMNQNSIPLHLKLLNNYISIIFTIKRGRIKLTKVSPIQNRSHII